MRKIALCSLLLSAAVATVGARPSGVEGTYVEARTAEVFTGGCIMNGEAGTAGREALLAWKVDRGTVDGVNLDGLAVVAAVAADTNLGVHEIGGENPTNTRAALYVDQRATDAQKQALVSMVKSLSGDMVGHVIEVTSTPIEFSTGAGDIRVAAKTLRLTVHKHLNHERQLRQQAVVRSAVHRRPRGARDHRGERVQRRGARHEVERPRQAVVVLRHVRLLARSTDRRDSRSGEFTHARPDGDPRLRVAIGRAILRLHSAPRQL